MVSAIIPTYKRPTLVRRAIRSVLNQTVRDLEVIVVDDASPDDTARVVAAIADERIRYIRHQRNRGLPASRNTGIRVARGRYIAFLDDDDEWLPNKTEKQLRYLQDHGVDAVVGLSLINGKVPTERHQRPLITVDDLRRGNRWGSCSLFVKAEVIRDVSFDESLTIGEDWDAYIRIAQNYRLGCINEPLFIYHQIGHDSENERMLNMAREPSRSEIRNRTRALYKHRALFGEQWFRYHMARALLANVSSRRDKLGCLRHAVRSCGFRAVALAVAKRARWRLWQSWCTGVHRWKAARRTESRDPADDS